MENPINMDDLGIPLFLETPISHRIHVWYIYLHLVDFYGKYIGKYTRFRVKKQVIPLCEF